MEPEIGLLELELAQAQGLQILNHLSDEQKSAMRFKLRASKIDFVKETKVPDQLTAYFVYKAQKEASDQIFSMESKAMGFTLERWYMSLVSPAENVVALAYAEIDRIIERTDSDKSKASKLAAALRSSILAGKLEMDPERREAFLKLCEYMGVDAESLK